MFIDNVPPPSSQRRNILSALAQSEFVLAELLRLETLGCIRRVDYVPHIVNPLMAVHSKKSQHGCVRWAQHTITCNHVGISPAEGIFNYLII